MVHPEAAPEPSGFGFNPYDHLRYRKMIELLERCSRDQLLEMAKKMAYQLCVVEPAAKACMIRMATARPGAAAEGAMAALGSGVARD